MSVHIKQLLENFLQTVEKKQEGKEKILKITESVLGKATVKCLQVSEITHKEIIFTASSSGVKYNLQLQKKELVEKIKSEFPEINKITVRMGEG